MQIPQTRDDGIAERIPDEVCLVAVLAARVDVIDVSATACPEQRDHAGAKGFSDGLFNEVRIVTTPFQATDRVEVQCEVAEDHGRVSLSVGYPQQTDFGVDGTG